jgi:uncharacterized protein
MHAKATNLTVKTACRYFCFLFLFQILLLLAYGQNQDWRSNQIPNPKPNTYVNDYTSTLSKEEIYRLNQQIKTLEQQTTVQMAVLLINQLPTDMSIEDFARNVGNQWKVGLNQNGIVYVAVLEEHRQRLEIARNLEGEIPDITAAEIIDQLKPHLRQQDYHGAMELLVSEVSRHLGTPADVTIDTSYSQTLPGTATEQSDPVLSEHAKFEREKAKYDRYGGYVIGALVLGAIGFCIWAWRYRKKYVEMYTVDGVYTGIGSAYYASIHGDDTSSDNFSGGAGFGGFGGGGGGGFSGGGASGSW